MDEGQAVGHRFLVQRCASLDTLCNSVLCGESIRKLSVPLHSARFVPAHGDVYRGEWAEDLKNGSGTYYYRERRKRYDGIWVNDVAKCGVFGDLDQQAFSTEPFPIPKVRCPPVSATRTTSAMCTFRCGLDFAVGAARATSRFRKCRPRLAPHTASDRFKGSSSTQRRGLASV